MSSLVRPYAVIGLSGLSILSVLRRARLPPGEGEVRRASHRPPQGAGWHRDDDR